ncbi:hypothetical protein Tel_09360 [Candidatus Tenderia electrophaga]|jgi:hypothetical protein|uniref:DUF1496 domain-containing protein n=1 Tax=Candidatus Tenderia electrophaga TaxID=1748243 RepID=A0A0S2TI08_9GAMM|nr:hypothetical protein Tel_09360 [Candidatus Tenderia electrophaga]
MNQRPRLIQVGAPDLDAKTSPILEETDEEMEVMALGQEDQTQCYFNNVAYPDGSYVCSGSGELLHCEKGIWIMEGGCDPDNP